MYRILAESVISFENGRNVVYANSETIKKSLLSLSTQQQNDSTKNILIRSESDKFDYRLIQLNNGLQLLLISDPTYVELSDNQNEQPSSNIRKVSTSEKSDFSDNESDSSSQASSSDNEQTNAKGSALAVAVRVGSFQDPREVQGMAHMLEHLLTMGSGKFPAENEIDEFLSSRGGMQNAHTDCNHTLYEIKVHRRYLKEALNLIGHCFVDPLLRQQSIDKEVKPIETEFVEACNDDDARAQTFFAHLARSDHPMSKFLWGNTKSLINDPKSQNVDIRQMVLDFYHLYYTPENIVVVVQSQHSLEDLQQWTVEIFGQVTSKTNLVKNLTIPKPPVTLPFDGQENRFCNTMYHVESISSGWRFVVNWCFEPVCQNYIVSPYDYLASLIGHEGKGSLISKLRKSDLAMDIYTNGDKYCLENNLYFSMFSIDIHLTEKGFENLEQIYQYLFEYLAVLKKVLTQESYYREKQIIALESFNKRSGKNPLSYSIELAKNLLFYPTQHILTADSLYYEFDAAPIDRLLLQMEPESANFLILHNKLDNQPNVELKVEPWMNIKYQEFKVPSNWIVDAKRFTGESQSFHHPKSNPFIATNFEILSKTLVADAPERLNNQKCDYPIKLIDKPRLTVWHRTDFKFNLPKACCYVHILSPFNENNLENTVLNGLLLQCIDMALKEEVYEANEANLSWNINRTFYGLLLSANGFNEKLLKLVSIILERFQTIELDDERLESFKQDIYKQFYNEIQDSEALSRELMLSIMLQKYFPCYDQMPLIESINKEQLLAYKKKFLSNLSLEILIQGNIGIQETSQFSEKVWSIFDLSNQNLVQENSLPIKTKCRVAQLKPGVITLRALTITRKNRISYVCTYQQLEPFSFLSGCYQSLFVEMINELCFNVLRTEEGLGYSVGCMVHTLFGILGFSVYVAFDERYDCTFVQKRIDNFLTNVCHDYIFQKLTEKKFDEFVSSKIKQLLSPDISLEYESRKRIEEIATFDYCFDRIKREVSQYQKVSLSEFKDWAAKSIFLGKERKLFTVQVIGNGAKALDECLTLDRQPVTEKTIPEDYQPGKQRSSSSPVVQLLLSKTDDPSSSFIVGCESFKRESSFYEAQKLLCDTFVDSQTNN